MPLAKRYHYQVSLGALTPDAAQVEALHVLEQIRGLVEAPVPKRSILWRLGKNKPVEGPRGAYLWGGVGRGKSMLMDFFFDVVKEPKKRRVHFHAFMQEVHGALHEARKTGVEDALVPVAQDISDKVRLLCFDEMQVSDITDAMLVGRLFTLLFEAGVIVVTTSNRHPRDLYKDGWNRDQFVPFIELVLEKLVVHELVSPTDHRQNRLEGEARYFTPINAAARAALDRIWAEMSGGKAQGLTLSVKGREMEIPNFQNGTARMRFWDLCGKPLGAGDYLALAEAVRMLILDDIPRLSRSNFNEAKRFVTLIDALYEGKVTLIASAAAQPETLYVEGEGTFEFERTASRLREMQGADWPPEEAV